MNKTIFDYIKTCGDDVLYSIFSKSIEEMNKRKDAENKNELKQRFGIYCDKCQLRGVKCTECIVGYLNEH